MAEERTDHIWFRHNTTDGGKWKCCLCGALTSIRPLSPTPAKWQAMRYERLTDEERAIDPFVDEPAPLPNASVGGQRG